MKRLPMFTTFGVGLAYGGILSPTLHWCVFKTTDPFTNGWPGLLQTTAFLGSFVSVLAFKCRAVGAMSITAGTTLGLICWMTASGQTEYPVSSIIAIFLHAFFPSTLGYAAGCFVRFRRRPNEVKTQ